MTRRRTLFLIAVVAVEALATVALLSGAEISSSEGMVETITTAVVQGNSTSISLDRRVGS
jgi:hypothetical protein